MGLFDFFTKKSSGKKSVWRNAQGVIACPGDSCPKDCDDTCPIYLNTQAAMLMSIGQNVKAIPLYKKALDIAPDFYDAWNNLGGIYGGQGEYQNAYNHYFKAHELNPQKPNPVFGLMLTSRDLGRFEECIKWCDLYKTLSRDGRDVPIRNVALTALGRAAENTNKTNRF